MESVNFDGFSLAELYQQRISHLHGVVRRIYNFPKKSELSKFILPVKIRYWLITFCGFWGGNEKLAEITDQDRLTSLLVSQFRRSILRTCSDVSLLASCHLATK